jgi:CheY-like chemotaxis protein/nitrogen-specific signal transduction histidine kinase
MLKLLRQLSSRSLLLQTIRTLEQEQLELNRRHEAIEKSCLEQKAYLREAFHELRNGVHVIAGNSALLSKWTDGSQLPVQAVRLARNIREASRNMLHFLEAGLQLAQPEGAYQPQWETLQIRPWLEKTTSAYHYHAAEKQLRIQCNMPQSFPAFIEMDIMLLRQIVCNLLHNAIKFSPCGNRIRIDCFEGSHEWTMIFINKAPAISKEQVQHIFEPFYTLGHPESNTGLGLTITRKYVEMLGGTIKATCINDQFLIWLRLPMKIAGSQPEPLLMLKRPEHIPIIHSSRKVMVIEDNPMSQRLICNYLHEVGLRQIAVVAHAKDALRLARQLKPDLVFMDVHLPDQNGIETMQSLRAILKDVPLIAMTGDENLSDNAPLLQAGANEYILKPFELHQIAGIVQKYLDFAAN